MTAQKFARHLIILCILILTIGFLPRLQVVFAATSESLVFTETTGDDLTSTKASYRTNPDGSKKTHLVRLLGSEPSRVLPRPEDGARVISYTDRYLLSKSDGTDLYNLSDLTTYAYGAGYAWEPDANPADGTYSGSRMAFSGKLTSESYHHVYIMDLTDPSAPVTTEITPMGSRNQVVMDWSPSGILFRDLDGTNKTYPLFVADPTTKTVSPLGPRKFNVIDARYSSMLNKILLVGMRKGEGGVTDTSNKLFTINPDGTAFGLVPLSDSTLVAHSVAPIPPGSAVCTNCAMMIAGPTPYKIYQVALDTGAVSAVTSPASDLKEINYVSWGKVEDPNNPPAVGDDSYSVDEDAALTVAAPGVLGNDSDPDGNLITAILVTGPAKGTLTFNTDGSFSYTPDPNYHGPDSFTYKANDGQVDSTAHATVSLTVNGVNDPPVAADDNYFTNEDVVLAVGAPGVLGNDSDIDGGALTAAVAVAPTNGALTLNADGSFTYTPNLNFYGTDSFTYTVADGNGGSDTGVVSVAIDAVNDAPVAVADSYSTNEDVPLSVTAPGVLGNDSDAEGDPLTAMLVTGPANGTLTLNADGSFAYTPTTGYFGTDSFTYKVNDGKVDSAAVTVDINVVAVNDPPVANDDSYSANEDTTLAIAAPGVLGNDTDPESDALTVSLVSGPDSGSLTLNPDGSFSYAPVAQFFGTVTFTYKASDGFLDSHIATVTIAVQPVNDAPVAHDESHSVSEDTALTVSAPGVLSNDTDVEGDPLTAVLATGPSNGTLTLNPDGSFSYTPSAHFSGTDSFTYKANDGSLDSNNATITIAVQPVNDRPVANDDSYSADEDTTLTIPAPGVLSNDSDVDGDPLVAVLVAGPSNGTLMLNADGSFTYTPNANYFGPDGFTYRANDGALDSNTATVSITVNPVSEPPTALDDSYSTNEDTALTVAAPGVLANDSDADGDPLTAVLATGPSNGTLTLNANGSFVYTPNPDFSGTDSFTYRAFDGSTTSNLATVTITVAPVNDAPDAADDRYSTHEDTALTVAAPGVLANDSDPDGDPLTAVLVTGPASGALTLNTDGSFTYTPVGNFTGTDSFTYQVSDGSLSSHAATVTITVGPVNDPPVNTVPGAQSVNEEADLVFSSGTGNQISVFDHDAGASDELKVTLSVNEGALTLSSTSGLTFSSGDGLADKAMIFTGTLANINAALDGMAYRGGINFNGSDTLTLTTDDQGYSGAGGALADTDTVGLTVNAVNDPPVNEVPPAQTTSGDVVLVFSAGNGNLIGSSDPDAGSGALEVTLSVTDGTLTLSAVAGLSFTSGDGTADATMTFAGSLADINAALDGLSYSAPSGFGGTATLTITTNDQGNTGSGGALSDTDSVDINVRSLTVADKAGQFSDQVTLEATLSPVLAGETITFKIDGVTVGTGITDGAGKASYEYRIELAAGSYPITAEAAGSATATAIEGTGTLTVSREDAALFYTGETLTDGGPINLAAHLDQSADGSLGDITLAGSIEWVLRKVSDGSTAGTYSGAVDGGGDASAVTASLSNIPYDVTVSLLANGYYQASPVTARIKGTPSMAVTDTSGQYSDQVTLGATLSGGEGGLSGKSVTFKVNGESVGTGTTDSSGVAALGYLIRLPAGSYTITAEFAGDLEWAAAAGNGTLTVNAEGGTIAYTGGTYFQPGTVPLSATFAQEDDGYPGDTTLASHRYRAVNVATGINYGPWDDQMDANGHSDTSPTLSSEGEYSLTVSMPGNGYFTAADVSARIYVDGTPPTVPNNFKLDKGLQCLTISLSWDASADTLSGVQHYRVYRSTDKVNFSVLATTVDTYYDDKDVASEVKYYYKVTAVDRAGNESNPTGEQNGDVKADDCADINNVRINDSRTEITTRYKIKLPGTWLQIRYTIMDKDSGTVLMTFDHWDDPVYYAGTTPDIWVQKAVDLSSLPKGEYIVRAQAWVGATPGALYPGKDKDRDFKMP